VAVGPGCVLRLEGIVSEATPAWLAASAVTAKATTVTTRFTAPPHTVVILLAGSDEHSPASVELELSGATRAIDSHGAEQAPRVVMSGSRAALLYDVVPTLDDVVSVRVRAGGSWRLAGVMGGDGASATLAQTIASKGIAALAGRLLIAADGAPISVTWAPPSPVPVPSPRTPPRSRGKSARTTGSTVAPQKSATKKTASGKTASKKTAAKKTGPQKTPRKGDSHRAR
jgi:hypothetical protein